MRRNCAARAARLLLVLPHRVDLRAHEAHRVVGHRHALLQLRVAALVPRHLLLQDHQLRLRELEHLAVLRLLEQLRLEPPRLLLEHLVDHVHPRARRRRQVRRERRRALRRRRRPRRALPTRESGNPALGRVRARRRRAGNLRAEARVARLDGGRVGRRGRHRCLGGANFSPWSELLTSEMSTAGLITAERPSSGFLRLRSRFARQQLCIRVRVYRACRGLSLRP